MTSSLSCLSCRIPYQSLHSLNVLPSFSEKALLFPLISGSSHPLPQTPFRPIGRAPKGSYPPRGRSGHLLETPFSEPLLRTLLRTLFYCKTHSKTPSKNPSENPSPEPFPRTLPRTFSEPFSERCVAVRPLRRAAEPRTRLMIMEWEGKCLTCNR